MKNIKLIVLFLSIIGLQYSYAQSQATSEASGEGNRNWTIKSALPAQGSGVPAQIILDGDKGVGGYGGGDLIFKTGGGYPSSGAFKFVSSSLGNSIPDKELMRINIFGRIGVGVTHPQSKLHLDNLSNRDGIRFGNKFRIVQSETTNNNFIMENIAPNGNLYLRSRIDGVGNTTGNIILNDIGGNVGIGTTNPKHKLDVYTGHGNFKTYNYGAEYTVNTTGGWARSIRFRNENDNSTVTFGGHSGAAFISTGTYSDPQSPSSIGYEKKSFTLSKEGNVGIGTSNPMSKLEIRGSNNSVFSDFANYNGVTVNNYLPNGKEPTLIIVENSSGNLIPATGGQVTYRGGLSFGRGGPGIYSVNPNPAGSGYYGELRFHTTYWNGSNFNNADRMVIKRDGNVGIGTTDPKTRLHVNGSIRGNIAKGAVRLAGDDGYVDIGALNPNWLHIYTDRPKVIFNKDVYTTSNGFSSYNDDLILKTKGTEKLRIDDVNGNVGIGTTNPKHKLDVYTGHGNFKTYNYGAEYTVNTTGDWARSIRFRNENDNSTVTFGGHSGTAFISTGTYADSQSPSSIGYEKKSFTLSKEGNVGIGTSYTKGYKLAVDGKVISEEVKVQLSENWTSIPDYVFKSDYKLPTLKEVENHIKEKGHLKNIPSAKEIEREGGIFIGEMNLKLLEKIEELTLYTIQQEKEIKELKKLKVKTNLQDQKIELLLKRLEQLEASK